MRKPGIEGLEPPRRTCDDDRCPWHGNLSIRGRLLKGVVISNRAKKMVVVEREYYHYVKKYMRYEKRRSRIHAYLPSCIDVDVGTKVIIGECRPLAKSVSFVVLGKEDR